jgi:uncharacterized flavoprotein (TIGR03862 family)
LVAQSITIIGGGPAGLMAAEVLSAAGASVTVHEAMPSVGRKFLMAGRGGLNLTHAEPLETFVTRYGTAHNAIAPILDAFPPAALSAWAESLGQPVFTGSSGRVFPEALKASPLLRAWISRLAGQGVTIHTRSVWRGWKPDGTLRFDQQTGQVEIPRPDATILALGGASWPRLGSNGSWGDLLREHHIGLSPFRPANCGFEVAWSESFKDRFSGQPLKAIGLGFQNHGLRGEAVVTRHGLEGGGIYAISAPLRDAIAAHGSAVLRLDLRPDMSQQSLADRLAKPRGGASTSNWLRKALNLSPLEINLLREAFGQAFPAELGVLSSAIKDLPIRLLAPRPLDRAISTAGGVRFDAVDDHLMLNAIPNTYAVGEMLDWEAPTGGYLLQACFATGAWAARSILERARL